MPANDERVPRKRASYHKEQAPRRGRPPKWEYAVGSEPAPKRGRPPKREGASSRGRSRERARAPSSRERERTPKRGRPSEQERTASRKRVPERGQTQGRRRAPERERTETRRTSERKRAPARRAAPGRGRPANRRPAAQRKRAVRRRRAARGGFAAILSRTALLVLLLLALGKVGDRFVFQELQVYHPDKNAVSDENPVVPPVDKTVSASSRLPTRATVPQERIDAAAPDTIARPERKDGFYTILLAGVDDHNGGSDTVIFVGVDAKNNRIFGVSIPRDTKAVINGKPYKINAAYKMGGMELLAQTVSEQMAVPVDYTVRVDLEGFAALIDAVGGVDFDVPIDMDYEDPKQNLEIHISKGLQHLDGESALKVVRFRHNSDGTGYGDEDLGRIRTQQNFLRTAAKSLLSLSSLTKLDDFARIFQKYVKTELTLPNLAWLAKEAFAARNDGIQFATLPGTWKSPYIYTDRQGALELINAHLNPYKEDRTLEDLNFPS
ncbi:MAG: LCP family protein [Oscillibacter sp.]|nr:LCP family protein [Oscillibacter sp.]